MWRTCVMAKILIECSRRFRVILPYLGSFDHLLLYYPINKSLRQTFLSGSCHCKCLTRSYCKLCAVKSVLLRVKEQFWQQRGGGSTTFCMNAWRLSTQQLFCLYLGLWSVSGNELEERPLRCSSSWGFLLVVLCVFGGTGFLNTLRV